MILDHSRVKQPYGISRIDMQTSSHCKMRSLLFGSFTAPEFVRASLIDT